MTMTPRKKTKPPASQATNTKTRKRGRAEDAATSSTATSTTGNTPPDVRRSQRTLAHSSPTEAAQESPRKTRRTGPSPETPLRVSPRGKRESGSPTVQDTMGTPVRRGRRGRRGSTDSSTSSVGNASVASSTPGRGRTRRESNSSAVSGASDTSQVTPSTPRRGGGSKRKLASKQSPVSSKSANGPSPQYSPDTKKRRGNVQRETVPSTTNGRSGGRLRSRRRICETPQENLDGDAHEEQAQVTDQENSDLDNGTDDVKLVKKGDTQIEEDRTDTNTSCVGDSSILGPITSNSDETLGNGVHDESVNKTEAGSEILSEDSTSLCKKESDKECDCIVAVPELSMGQRTVAAAKPRTRSSNIRPEKSSESTNSELPARISSHTKSAKRRHKSGDSSNSESPGNTLISKKAKYSASVPENDESVMRKGDDSVKSDIVEPENKPEVDSSNSASGISMDGVEEDARSNRRVARLLDTFGLTDEQSQEICSLLQEDATDLLENRIIEELVERLLNGSTTVGTMNAPRFNKFLRQLLTHYCCLDTTKGSKHSLCEKAVQWARDRKSVNLRHELELTLMSLYYNTLQYKKAEGIANALYAETKKLQDKEKTVKACLCLSQVYHAMGNISKARANITTAKTEALKIYTPPDMQGELDLQSGIMQVAEGKDMETAFSYFKEAATGFVSHKQRARALKYMLLSKIMVNRSEEGEKAVRSQSHVQDIDEGVEAMLAIAGAANKSSLKEFRKIREEHKEHLAGDTVVAGVLDDLYTAMMEKNLLNIVLPYERLQIGHIAEKIGLPREEVERRVSQMILDRRINAQLDHRDDCLYVYAAEDSDIVYQTGIKTLSQLDKTISHLNRKVKKLL